MGIFKSNIVFPPGFKVPDNLPLYNGNVKFAEKSLQEVDRKEASMCSNVVLVVV